MGKMVTKSWEELTKELRQRCMPIGMDIVAPLNLSWYNAAVPRKYHIHCANGEENVFAVLIGNSKKMWEPFKRSLGEEQHQDEHCIPERTGHPMNNYTEKNVFRIAKEMHES